MQWSTDFAFYSKYLSFRDVLIIECCFVAIRTFSLICSRAESFGKNLGRGRATAWGFFGIKCAGQLFQYGGRLLRFAIFSSSPRHDKILINAAKPVQTRSNRLEA